MSGPHDKKQLGKILLKQRAVSPAELDRLLEEQKANPGARLASVAANAGIDEVDLLRALSDQHQVPGIDLSQLVVPVSNLKLVPLEVARQYLILPFSLSDEQILLAMADPQDQRVIDEIEFVTGRTVGVYVALHEPLTKVIEDAYAVAAKGEEFYVGPAAPAEYLASLGLSAPAPAPKSPPRPPPPPPPRAKVDAKADVKAPEDFSDLFADDESAAPPPEAKDARGRAIAALDPAFESRVAALPTEEPRVQRARGERKVLIVDDEDDIRRLLKRVLTERGFSVLEAARGSDALQMVRDHVPDLILLDAMLPEIHGFDICRRIKGSQKYGHIPIIMISAVYRGWRFAEDLKESYGVDGFLEKPFKIADVTAAVDAALEGGDEAPRDEDTISEPAGEALASGIDAYKRGDLDTAITHLKRGLGIDPLAFRLHYHLGLLYGRRENVFEAIAAMEAAVDLSPRSFAALKNLAVLYQRAGFKHKAIEIWERALGSAQDDETRLGIKEHLMSLL
jgi:DNA-binding response OmpR family regulator